MIIDDQIDALLSALEKAGIATKGVQAARAQLAASPWPRDFEGELDPRRTVATSMVNALARDVVDRKVNATDLARRVMAIEARQTQTWGEVENTVRLYWKRNAATKLTDDAAAIAKAVEKAVTAAAKDQETATAQLEAAGVRSATHAAGMGARVLAQWEAKQQSVARLQELSRLRRWCIEAGLIEAPTATTNGEPVRATTVGLVGPGVFGEVVA